MPNPTEFCPTLPEPYEGRLREALDATWRAERHQNDAIRLGMTPEHPICVEANHAAAEAEHALRVALLALMTGGGPTYQFTGKVDVHAFKTLVLPTESPTVPVAFHGMAQRWLLGSAGTADGKLGIGKTVVVSIAVIP